MPVEDFYKRRKHLDLLAIPDENGKAVNLYGVYNALVDDEGLKYNKRSIFPIGKYSEEGLLNISDIESAVKVNPNGDRIKTRAYWGTALFLFGAYYLAAQLGDSPVAENPQPTVQIENTDSLPTPPSTAP